MTLQMMKNMRINSCYFFWLFTTLLLTTNSVFSQLSTKNSDSLRIYFKGLKNGETYSITYDKNKRTYFKCECGNARWSQCYFYFSIKVDSLFASNIKPLGIKVHKVVWPTDRDLHLNIYNSPYYKYLIFFRSNRIKKKYVFDYVWADGVGLSPIHGQYFLAKYLYTDTLIFPATQLNPK